MQGMFVYYTTVFTITEVSMCVTHHPHWLQCTLPVVARQPIHVVLIGNPDNDSSLCILTSS